MSLTLLLDLDDTLLDNDINSFLPQYLEAFSREVASYVEPSEFVANLLAGTREMLKNRRPDCTLKEAFEEAFFSTIEIDPSEFRLLAEKFYEKVFPTLQGLTQPRPGAVQLVETAQARGYQLAIATNPLFPRTAILQRLSWANLPPELFSYEVITSYETFHFAKPEPAYFAEIMARMGWPSEPIVVVGDDLERDIIPARQLGLAAFWVTRKEFIASGGLEEPTASGSVGDVLAWLESVQKEDLMPDYTSPSAMQAILRATPAALDSFCRDLPKDNWVIRPKEDEWSLTEILCHLRDVDLQVNLPRLRKVLSESNPFLPGEDTDRWAVERGYIQQDGRKALHQFIAARIKLLDMLDGVESLDWERTARHAIFGPTRLAELVNIIAQHDRLHLHQVHGVLGEIVPSS